MKILVTGSDGFVGKHTIKYFESQGYETIGFDTKKGGDVRDKNAVQKVMATEQPDYVLHLAWIVDKRNADRNPYDCFTVGLDGTLNLLEFSSVYNVQRFLFMNSSQTYGNSSGEVSETSPFNPENCYARSKIAALYMLEQYAKSKSLPYCAITSWELFGENAPMETIVMRFMSKALKDENITLYCYGKQSFDLNYVENICIAYELGLLKSDAVGQLINIGSGSVITLKELAELIVETVGSKSKIRLAPARKDERLWNSYPNLDKAKSILNYSPSISLQDGLNSTSRWLKSCMSG